MAPVASLRLEILRHGHAEPSDAGGDAQRPLSPAGRRAMERLAARLAVEGWRPGWIFSSPLVRARQTAEIVRDACAGALEIEALEELLPEWEPEGVLSAVEARGALEGHVLLVSHQPIAGRVVRLLTGDAPAIRPGTLVEVECEADLVPGRGRVVRVIDPEPGD